MAAQQNEEATPKGTKAGRPSKYKAAYAQEAYELCLLGLTDAQLAEHFEVNADTIHEWKKVHPEFSESVRKGKIQADSKVAAALYKRALGFSYDEITFEKVDNKTNLEITPNALITQDAYKKKIVTKLVIPDTGAQMNWLKNRQKELWRDNDIDFDKLTDEQLDRVLDRILARQQKKGQ